MIKHDYIDDQTIKLLIDGFYSKLRQEPVLGAIFEKAIGTSDSDWQPHLEKMYDFWSSIMLSTGRYRGTPMQKHQELPRFQIELFDRWLYLFKETAQELHTDDIVAQYSEKSSRIAESLKLSIYFKPNGTSHANSSQ